MALILCFLQNPANAVRNAPVTTASSVMGNPSHSVVIPLTVTGFTSVSAISLRLEYTNAVMTFDHGTPNPHFSGVMFNALPVPGVPGLYQVRIVYSGITPVTLANNDTIVWLTFNYLSGGTSLAFNNTSNGGGDCEYADELGNVLTDTPTATFYHDGSISQLSSVLNLNNITVGSGQVKCYNATQLINVAGNGTTFLVQTGGNVTMISGDNILIEPGTTVQLGGYLMDYITTTQQYCINPSFPSVLKDNVPAQFSAVHPGNDLFTVYPNPTADRFTLELNAEKLTDNPTVTIYGLLGEPVLKETVEGNGKKEFSLSGKPNGIYIIRVNSGNFSGIEKIVKQ